MVLPPFRPPFVSFIVETWIVGSDAQCPVATGRQLVIVKRTLRSTFWVKADCAHVAKQPRPRLILACQVPVNESLAE